MRRFFGLSLALVSLTLAGCAGPEPRSGASEEQATEKRRKTAEPKPKPTAKPTAKPKPKAKPKPVAISLKRAKPKTEAQIRQGLASKDLLVQAAALDALTGELERRFVFEVAPRVIHLLRRGKTWAVRWSAAESFRRTRYGSDAVIAALKEALTKDRSHKVRASSARALGQIGVGAETLRKVASDDRHQHVRRSALVALSRIGRPDERMPTTEANPTPTPGPTAKRRRTSRSGSRSAQRPSEAPVRWVATTTDSEGRLVFGRGALSSEALRSKHRNAELPLKDVFVGEAISVARRKAPLRKVTRNRTQFLASLEAVASGLFLHFGRSKLVRTDHLQLLSRALTESMDVAYTAGRHSLYGKGLPTGKAYWEAFARGVYERFARLVGRVRKVTTIRGGAGHGDGLREDSEATY